MRVLVICGSPRKESSTRILANVAYDYGRSKYDDIHYLEAGTIEPFRGFEAAYKAETKATVSLLESTNVFIIATPVYNGLLSSALKNLFEFVDYKALEGSAAGFITKSAGNVSALQVQSQLFELMTYFRVISNPRSVFIFDSHFQGDHLADPGMEKRIRRLVDETVALFVARPPDSQSRSH
ncbi:MAG: NAD(P)H-dependent oxidoreductase [Chloroflexi bacterium]|nr:NAD(P)H-dependent oxidoreductase [Chloroflexota bacterium]